MIIFIVLLIFFILILLISFLSIELRFKYLRQNNNDHITLIFSVLRGWLNYQLDIPKINIIPQESTLKLKAELENEKSSPVSDKHKKYSFQDLYKEFLHWYPIIKEYLPAVRFLLKKVIPDKVKWQTELGLSDAALTGMSVGILWAVKSTILSNIYRYLAKAHKPPDIKIIPHYNKKTLTINIDCIFNVKIGYIMITGLKCLWVFSTNVLHKILCLLGGEFGGRTTTSN